MTLEGIESQPQPTLKQHEPSDYPRFHIDRWRRFPQKLDFSKNFRAVVTGVTGTGKSALVEVLGCLHDKHNNGNGKIIDLFSARDNEGLSWCRHRLFKNNVLFVHGDSTKISSEWDEKKISELRLSDFAEHKTIISVPAFYDNLHEEYYSLDRMSKLLWKRTHWDRPWFIAVREGTSLLYSRIGLGDNQTQSKAAMVYWIREMRHCGFAIAVDIIRFKGLDIEVRSLADYLFIKAHGIEGLPADLSFIYGHYDLFSSIMKMPKWCFILLTNEGGIAEGRFRCPEFHKEEREDLLSLFNIEVKYGDAINYADKGHNHVSDFEHIDILRLRTGKGCSMSTLAKGGTFTLDDKEIRLEKRSSKTIYHQIDNHNQDIDAQGYCQICHRLDQMELARQKA